MRAVTALILLPLLVASGASAEFRQTSPEYFLPAGVVVDDLPDLTFPSPMATGCDRTVGLMGFPFAELVPFIEANGLTVLPITGADIAGGALASIDVLYVQRGGTGDAAGVAVQIDAWIQGGGVMVTEFTATTLFYNPGPLNYLAGALVDGFWVPSGTVCGGNTVVVNDPTHGLATDLPAAWDCSGDPIGVLHVFTGIDPQLCIVASVFGSDRDGDGVDDPVVGAANIGLGAIVPFFSDFQDWQALMDPRDCAFGASCNRDVNDETLMLNALCRVAGCEPVVSVGCSDCEGVHAMIDTLDIDVEGVRKSLHSQFSAACRALERGQLHTAGNILCAMLNHNEAQFGKHISEESAIALEQCVRSFATANDIPLRVPDDTCGTVLDGD